MLLPHGPRVSKYIATSRITQTVSQSVGRREKTQETDGGGTIHVGGTTVGLSLCCTLVVRRALRSALRACGQHVSHYPQHKIESTALQSK